MPDGDRIYTIPLSLPGRTTNLYQAYHMLVERQPLSDVAYHVQKEIAAWVRYFKNEPRELMEQAANVISSALQQFRSGNDIALEELSLSITELAEQVLGNRRGMPIAVDACKEQLLDLSPEQSTEELLQSFADKYLWRIYDAQFSESCPLYYHETGMSQQEFDGLLNDLRQEIKPYMDMLIERFVRVADVKNLRAASRDDDPDGDIPDDDSIFASFY